MSRRDEPYMTIVVESYLPDNTAGLHGPVHIRPIPAQHIDTDMHVECSKALSRNYPVGTRFRIQAKITDKEGGRPFLYSYFGWPYEVVD